MNPEAFRALRLKDGLSLAEAARRLEVTPSHLSNIEAGRRGASPALIKAMAVMLDVPITAIATMVAAVPA